MKERRAHERVKKYFAINIVSLEKGDDKVSFSSIKSNPKFCDESGLDFSPGGLKVICSKPLPEEAKIQMKLLIPDETGLNMIRANGSVRWFKQMKGPHKKYFVIGVQFGEMEDTEKDKLVKLWKKYKSA